MTTYFPFTPSNIAAPSFQPTLDGNIYACTVTWSLFGQRYYLNCFDANNDVIFTIAIVTSPSAHPLSTLSWNPATLLVTATTAAPHGFKIGTIVALTMANVSPVGYNGSFNCSITGPSTFTYPLSLDPGTMSSAGAASWQINLAAGYFQTSTIVYRNNQFEINP